ncbi:MAG: hypothetical protein ACF8R7_16055 [Phycisphaerales bacterium JB039]
MHPIADARLKFNFTYLGAHVHDVGKEARPIVTECLLGIAYPNATVGVKASVQVRPFACILRVMDALDGRISRDEMILGPLSMANDRDSKTFNEQVDRLRKYRRKGDARRAVEKLAQELGITSRTMENYTRFPLAVLSWTGWADVTKHSDRDEGPLRCRELTAAGTALVTRLRSMTDLRASDIEDLDAPLLTAIVRVAGYSLLDRAGFNTEPVQEQLQEYRGLITTEAAHLLESSDAELLFSPFQELAPDLVGRCFPTVGKAGDSVVRAAGRPREESPLGHRADVFALLRPSGEARPTAECTLEQELTEAIKEARNDADAAVDAMEVRLTSANQQTFYPMVASLFTLAGTRCRVSRAGVNYERFDGIIEHEVCTIPVEIKSPAEELFVGVKAIRQAAENKIVLLAREAFPTTLECASLVVGYKVPNDRSDVLALIDDLKAAFGIRIGVIDFRSLVRLAIASIVSGQIIEHERLAAFYGIAQEKKELA